MFLNKLNTYLFETGHEHAIRAKSNKKLVRTWYGAFHLQPTIIKWLPNIMRIKSWKSCCSA